MKRLLWLIFLLAAPLSAQMMPFPFVPQSASFPLNTLKASCTGTGTPASCSSPMTLSGGETIVCSASLHSFGTPITSVGDAANSYTINGITGISATGAYNNIFRGLLLDRGHEFVVAEFTNSVSGSVSPAVVEGGSDSGTTITCRAWAGAPTTNPIDGGVATQFCPLTGVGTTSTNPVCTTHVPTNSNESMDV